MATIDLGKLAFVNKGTYSSSTSYEKNDLVQYTDSGILSTYLYINSTAATGQTPSTSGTINGTYWTFFCKGGAAGAAGTDFASILANKEIAFKTNAGAIDGIGIGSAGQFLKVNSGATGYEFGEAGGGGYSWSSPVTVSTSTYVQEFTGISANAKAIIILGADVSSPSSGGYRQHFHFGHSGGYNTGNNYGTTNEYSSGNSQYSDPPTSFNHLDGVTTSYESANYSGHFSCWQVNASNNTWAWFMDWRGSSAQYYTQSGGTIDVGGTLTKIRLQNQNTSNNFTGGVMRIGVME